MSVDDAFATFQRTVNVPQEAIDLALQRRKFFHDALGGEGDVLEIIASGSLARGTHKDPINDVDVIVIYDEDHHPEWGTAGDSAADALSYTGKRINELLGATNGTFAREVRLASPRNHAVKCFLDDPDDPNAFTVDAMPAFRRNGALLVPEKNSERWVTTDPEHLISEVAKRHKQWKKYAGTVRMVKWWAADQDIKIKSLVMEILALDNLPLGPNRPAALKQFFNKAWNHVWLGYNVEDPAGHCGVIQRDLDLNTFADRLETARDLANMAFQAQARGEITLAHRFWKELFGDDFPPAPSGGGKPAVVPPVLPPRPVKDTPQG
jgi:hypothetical protein